jgi:hypothetical protein
MVLGSNLYFLGASDGIVHGRGFESWGQCRGGVVHVRGFESFISGGQWW